jgi:hypothetical protein
MNALKEYGLCLVDRKMMPTALKVALVVGSVLFMINHGTALLKGEMKRDRWISASLTYILPCLVNMHGQYISRSRSLSKLDDKEEVKLS